MYAILLGRIGKGIPRQEKIDFMLCTHEAAIEKLRLERDNVHSSFLKLQTKAFSLKNSPEKVFIKQKLNTS